MSKGRDRGTRRTAAQNHAQGEAPSGAAAALSGIPDAMRILYRSAVSGRDGCSACRSFSYSRGRNSVMTPRYRLGRNVF